MCLLTLVLMPGTSCVATASYTDDRHLSMLLYIVTLCHYILQCWVRCSCEPTLSHCAAESGCFSFPAWQRWLARLEETCMHMHMFKVVTPPSVQAISDMEFW